MKCKKKEARTINGSKVSIIERRIMVYKWFYSNVKKKTCRYIFLILSDVHIEAVGNEHFLFISKNNQKYLERFYHDP